MYYSPASEEEEDIIEEEEEEEEEEDGNGDFDSTYPKTGANWLEKKGST